MNALLLFAATACSPIPAELTVTAVPTGVEVSADSDLQHIHLIDQSGSLISTSSPLKDVRKHWLPIDWTKHSAVKVKGGSESRATTVEVVRPKTAETVQISAPLGQQARGLGTENIIQYQVVGPPPHPVGISLQVIQPGPVSVTLGGKHLNIDQGGAGQTFFFSGDVDHEAHLEIRADGVTTTRLLQARHLNPTDAAEAVNISAVRFPTDARGMSDVARPRQRITLASGWWSRIVRKLGLSYRPRDTTVPWAHQAVELSNTSDTDLNVVVRTRVTARGKPDRAFAPRMRDVDDGTGWTSVILRVPAGETAEAITPIFVDEARLSEDNRHRVPRAHHIRVTALGSKVPIAEYEAPLHIQRGSTTAAITMAIGCIASALGFLLLFTRLRHWLRMPTPTLVTIALFGTLSFVVNAAMQLLGMGVASLLGPFAFIATGLLDDTIRAVLLIVLLNLRPQAGVCGMAILIGWLLRAVTTGAASPADLLYLSGHLFFLEGALWLSGLTRGAPLTALRIAAALSTSFTASIATALAFNVVLYRLFYAEWYVALNVGLSGIIYPALATVLALPVAKSLLKVED